MIRLRSLSIVLSLSATNMVAIAQAENGDIAWVHLHGGMSAPYAERTNPQTGQREFSGSAKDKVFRQIAEQELGWLYLAPDLNLAPGSNAEPWTPKYFHEFKEMTLARQVVRLAYEVEETFGSSLPKIGLSASSIGSVPAELLANVSDPAVRRYLKRCLDPELAEEHLSQIERVSKHVAALALLDPYRDARSAIEDLAVNHWDRSLKNWENNQVVKAKHRVYGQLDIGYQYLDQAMDLPAGFSINRHTLVLLGLKEIGKVTDSSFYRGVRRNGRVRVKVIDGYRNNGIKLNHALQGISGPGEVPLLVRDNFKQVLPHARVRRRP